MAHTRFADCLVPSGARTTLDATTYAHPVDSEFQTRVSLRSSCCWVDDLPVGRAELPEPAGMALALLAPAAMTARAGLGRQPRGRP